MSAAEDGIARVTGDVDSIREGGAGQAGSGAAVEASVSIAPGPLAGLRVLELGALIAGPFAGRMLGDMGAEVIKIEHPVRLDPMRNWGHGTSHGRALWWPVQSRNKKGITLDLGTTRGADLLVDLVRHSDVVIENFRPGTLERWNLGFERLSGANHGVILVRVSGFGQTGPYARRAGFAAVAEAMSGLRYLNGWPGEVPPRSGLSLGDSLAALFAVHGVLAALYARDHATSGRGQIVDVSLVESCFALLESVVPEYDRLGAVREPSGTRLTGVAPSNIFKTRDGRWIVVAGNQDSVFGRLCEAMGKPDLAADSRFSSHLARGKNQDEIEAIVGEWVGGHDARDIDRRLDAAGVPCGILYSVADIFGDPYFHRRDMLVEHADPELGTFIGPGVVPKFGLTPSTVRWTGCWRPGSHNDDVYGGLLGLSSVELEALRDEGVI